MDHIEWEVKYRCSGDTRTDFKTLVSSLPSLKGFFYVEGTDSYYAKEDGKTFLRYRKPVDPNDKWAELTTKFKLEGAKNNIVRKEYNLRVDNTPKETVISMMEALGFKKNFIIAKYSDIYYFPDATLVFYTVVDVTDGNPSSVDHFIEIEVCEELIKELSEEQASEIVSKYEKALLPIGITPYKRLKKSLFEMYYRS